MKLPERTNEVTGIYAEKCIELAKEVDVPSINLWSKMQETEGWQKKFLRLAIPSMFSFWYIWQVNVFSHFEYLGWFAENKSCLFEKISNLSCQNIGLKVIVDNETSEALAWYNG